MRKNVLLIFSALVLVSGCYYEDIPRSQDPGLCLNSDLSVTATAQASSSCSAADGSISVSASGGTAPYLYSLDGGLTKQNIPAFQNLSGGTFEVRVYDNNQCSAAFTVVVGVGGTSFQASVLSVNPDTDCLTDNGSVQLQGSGGTGSYTYVLNGISNSTGSFSSLSAGAYTASIQNAGCSLQVSFTVSSQNNVSYANVIAPIISARCNISTCHGNSGTQTNLTTYESVKQHAADIKARTASGNMPKQPKPGGSLTADEIKLIACWVDAGALNN